MSDKTLVKAKSHSALADWRFVGRKRFLRNRTYLVTPRTDRHMVLLITILSIYFVLTLCVCVSLCRCPWNPEVSDPLKPELQAVRNHLLWMLAIKV